MDHILRGYSGPTSSICDSCRIGRAVWRCRTCIDRRPQCALCFRLAHQRDPFHRVEKWNGRYYLKAALWQVGVKLHIGHHGQRCPALPEEATIITPSNEPVDCLAKRWNMSRSEVLPKISMALDRPDGDMERRILEDVAMTVGDDPLRVIHNLVLAIQKAETDSNDVEKLGQTEAAAAETFIPSGSKTLGVEVATADLPPPIDPPEDDEDWEYEDDIYGIVPRLAPHVPKADRDGNIFVTIVHRDGFHHLPLVTCACSAEPLDIQVLDHRLYPATYDRVRTLFTFELLDDQRWDNLECKTSYYQYHQKLRRRTHSSCPDLAPNRLVELRRVARQWRNLKLRKLFWNVPDASGDGGSAEATTGIFCAACPQPGVNLPPGWETDQKSNP